MDPSVRFQEKSVIIHRDEHGFGLRVGGQNPVFVDFVHEHGAAWKAGVRKGDRIIKVNGTLVKTLDHQRVVKMIQDCSPFVHLALHPPDLFTDCTNAAMHAYTLGVDQNNGNVIAVGGTTGSELSSCTSCCSNGQGSSTGVMHVCSHNQAFNHPSPMHLNQSWRLTAAQSSTNWLLDIGDDLFQDNQQKQAISKQLQLNQELTPVSSQSAIAGGVSKLVVSGPNLLSHSNSSASLLSSSSNNRRSGALSNNNTRDNPYYYYKTANQQDKLSNDASNSINSTSNTGTTGSTITTSSSTASLLTSNETNQNSSTTSKVSSSMVRSRSSSKMSTRSTTSKYAKARNLRSRLVEDLRSFAIPNSQANPSSLSTSPSSSDLSDCDEPEQAGGLDCATNLGLNNSSLSQSPNSSNTIMITGINSSLNNSAMLQQQNTFNINNNDNKTVRLTTRRLEIIRELVDTEKTHIEKLKQLNDLLYKPIKSENLVPPDQLKMVFSCHKRLFKIHRQIYKKLVTAQINYSEQPYHHQQYLQEPLVGKAVLEIFEGELGKELENAASQFCACQSTNTDILNRITRKDTKSGEFLAQVANQQMLGRLGIKDLLASCFQRLTKYPLLLDNLLKATPNLIGAAATTDGESNNHHQIAGMIHSKSLSEGCIALSPNARVITNDKTINNNNNTIDESSQQDSNNQSANCTITSSKSNNDTAPIRSVGSPSNTNYESIDELLETTTSSAASSTAAATPTNATDNAGRAAQSEINQVLSLSDEYAFERFCIERALQSSRQILKNVNDAVERATAQQNLKEIWRKTDKNPHLPVIDIDSQQLLHEGPLILRQSRRHLEVYVLLLTNYLVILTRENQDKYKLKYFTIDGKANQNAQLSPIINIDEHLATRDLATDGNCFYLLYKLKEDLRIYEFASQSPTERNTWKDKIQMASKTFNPKAKPDDDNLLTRYTELISLTNTDNTPNNIEHSPTGSLATTTGAAVPTISSTSFTAPSSSSTATATTSTATSTTTTATAAQAVTVTTAAAASTLAN